MLSKLKIIKEKLFAIKSSISEFKLRLTEDDLYHITYMTADGQVFAHRKFALFPARVGKDNKLIWWKHFWIIIQIDRRTMHYAYEWHVVGCISDEECLQRVLSGEFI